MGENMDTGDDNGAEDGRNVMLILVRSSDTRFTSLSWSLALRSLPTSTSVSESRVVDTSPNSTLFVRPSPRVLSRECTETFLCSYIASTPRTRMPLPPSS